MIRQYRLIFRGEMAQENSLYRKLSEFFHRPEQVLAGLAGPDVTQEELRQQIVSCAVYDKEEVSRWISPVTWTPSGQRALGPGLAGYLQQRSVFGRRGYRMDSGSFGAITLGFSCRSGRAVAPRVYLPGLLSDSRIRWNI